MCVCVCERESVCVRESMCVCERACVCVRERGDECGPSIGGCAHVHVHLS